MENSIPADTLLKRAIHLLEGQNFDQSLELFLLLIGHDKTEFVYHEGAARCLRALGNYDAALRHIEVVQLISQGSADLRALRDEVLLAKKLDADKNSLNNLPQNIASIRPADLTPDGGRKFDFLFVPGPSLGGQTSLRWYLNLHPQVYVPGQQETDRAIQNFSEDQLCGDMQMNFGSRSEVKTGLLQHAYVEGRDPSSAGVAERLASIVSNESFIQVVRNPFEAARSYFDHRVYAAITSRFDQLELGWPNYYPLIELPPISRPPRFGSSDLAKIDWLELDQYLEMAAKQCRFFKSGKSYNSQFANWLTLDLEDLYPKRIGPTISNIFKWIGVDPNYLHPTMKKTLGSLSNRLTSLTLTMDICGMNVETRIAHEGLDMFRESALSRYIPIGRCDPQTSWGARGISLSPLILLVNTTQWKQVSPEDRKRLLGEQIPDQFLKKFGSYWCALTEILEKIFSQYQMTEQPKEHKLRAWSILVDDVSKFKSMHPEYEHKWGDLEGRFIHA